MSHSSFPILQSMLSTLGGCIPYAPHVPKVMRISRHVFDAERRQAHENYQDGSVFGMVLPSSEARGPVLTGVLAALLHECNDKDGGGLPTIIDEGANIGLDPRRPVIETGLFPRLKRKRESVLYPKLWSDSNYKSATDTLLEPFVSSTLKDELESGFIKEVHRTDLKHCCRLGAIGKCTNGHLTGTRIIEDHRRSGLDSKLVCPESCALPKGSDLISLLKAVERGEGPLTVSQLDTLQVITAQMPERYDGVSDLRIWFRRFEADAKAAGWDDHMMAERLGSFFRDSYFDTWDENAGKKSFAADREMMLQLFDLIRPDEALEKFHALSWDGKGHVSQFMAILKRSLEECDKMLPVKSRMLLDRVIACAPERAKPVLRRRRPKDVTDVCHIIGDYRGKQTRAIRHAAVAVTEDEHACPAAVAPTPPDNDKQLASLIESQTKAINAMHTSQNALLGSLKDILKTQQSPGGNGRGMRAGPAQPRRQLMPCGLCEGKHASYNCPHKKFSEGCYICGSTAHLSRSCPERQALLDKVRKGVTPEQGN
ncbi:hypothetical protein FOL47_011036 [Perkinsus chesapeaki]|uniref:CCHC-type domain-containing protein n=1 Tax=Perkinsus chesapeaki TaxID=330153 RepID=A0A7J6L029_PERCH|nr:hypothetical protein FOL47_011036 [Perkinsus chesapeaki]